MSKKVAVLMADYVEEIEYTSPKEAPKRRLYSRNHFTDGKEINGKNGEKFTPDKSIGAKAEDYAGILIPADSHLMYCAAILNAEFAKHFLENKTDILNLSRSAVPCRH